MRGKRRPERRSDDSVTAIATSAFVTQAQAEGKTAADNRVMQKLDGMTAELNSVKAEVVRLREQDTPDRPPLTPPR